MGKSPAKETSTPFQPALASSSVFPESILSLGVLYPLRSAAAIELSRTGCSWSGSVVDGALVSEEDKEYTECSECESFEGCAGYEV